MLRASGQYEKALDTQFGGRHVNERVVQHIVLAYWGGKESLDSKGSLMRRVLDRWNKDELREVINFLWMQRGEEIEQEVKERNAANSLSSSQSRTIRPQAQMDKHAEN